MKRYNLVLADCFFCVPFSRQALLLSGSEPDVDPLNISSTLLAALDAEKHDAFVVAEVIFVFVVVIDVGVDDDDDDIGNVKVKDDADDDVVAAEGDDAGKSKFNDDDGKDRRTDCGNSGDDKEWDDNTTSDVDIEKNLGEDCGKEE